MALYGATVPGVAALIPHRTLSATSQPTDTDVAGYLDRLSDWVHARFGDAIADVDPVYRTAVEGLARTAIQLGAAAWTHDAAFPERPLEGAGNYGAVLWRRFHEALAHLGGTVGVEVDGDGGVGGVTPPSPAWLFPEPEPVRW